MEKIVPYKDLELGKKEQVSKMFDNISEKYDFLNHFFSLGIDILWRKKSINLLKKYKPQSILDVATGTADFAIEALALTPKKIVGVDISEGMLAIGEKKIKAINKENIISLQVADSENLPFESNSFDAVIVSFGVRNFDNLLAGLTDMYRVTNSGGVCLVLEFSRPKSFPMKQLFSFYFKNIMPTIGKLVSKDSSAYTYLPESVKAFPDGDDFLEIFKTAGFKNTKCIPLTFGISSIYIGEK
ncbi:MAG: bifunctional demethylmenaquinone methyltransferase/2-methoxy-6-polyprenyl-1,4-benzoquinol methylase UbiE [Bacteroidota bacterium]